MSMNEHKFYIDGAWVDPLEDGTENVVNPANNETIATIAVGSAADVDRAVKAARAAFDTFSRTPVAERIALLRRIAQLLQDRREEMAQAISREMGAPITMARGPQSGAGPTQFSHYADVLENYSFEEATGRSVVVREPIGVCALITPWNWPLHQAALKIAPALAAGCTVVLKPSEISPFSALLLAEIMDEAGVPAGVFNLVNGTGTVAGAALSSHPEVDMVSFTGSTRGGVAVAKAAADTVKRVAQELGGKSPNVLLPDADFPTAVRLGVNTCFNNCGQSCSSPTRMIVPAERLEEVIGLAREAAEALKVGNPADKETQIGPLVSRTQWERVQGYIKLGVEEGATLVTGGPGHPEGLEQGNFVRPTVFAHVDPQMRIAREEIFGPVLCLFTYNDVEEAVRLANDTEYGLVAHVQSQSRENARKVAMRLRAGRVIINGTAATPDLPFGGYKQSGNGREFGIYGLEEFLEVKAVIGVTE